MHWITHIEGCPKRVNHAAVAVGHKIYSFGGYCTGESSRLYTSIDVHVLNTSTFRWTKHPVSDLPYFENDDILPYKRYGHSAAVYKDKIFIWGGSNHRASCAVLFCFDTVWHCWTAPQTYGEIPFARDGHTACIWRNQMLIFGGYEDDTDTFAKSIYSLNLDSYEWSYVYTTGPEPSVRDFHSALVINDRMYLFGGRGTHLRNDLYSPSEEQYSDELWYLDLKTHHWYKPVCTGARPIGRRSHSAFLYKDKMYIFGGYNSVEGDHYNDMYEFDPATNAWRQVYPLGEPPCKRRRQACVIVDDRVFLFGGTSPLADGLNAAAARDEELEEKLVDRSDMYILDFNVSLKTLCMMAVKRYKLDDSHIPYSLSMDIKNMFSANRITENRPSNSAG